MIRSTTAVFFIGTIVFLSVQSTAGETSTDVQLIFQEHCVSCHGPEEQNGGLRLDDLRTAFQEADSGEIAIVAGQPDKSALLQRLLTRDEFEQMPPEGDRLNEADISKIRRWIADGAEWEHAGTGPMSDPVESDHWAFQPIQTPEIPLVQDRNWPRGILDHFVQAKRESNQLEPVADAPPAKLIRRVTYGLTGLPPTSDEVRDFVQHCESMGTDLAMEKLVDDLLGRQSYGERWGRHWMDWVRYADTAGDNSDFPIPEAYLYRNYIIDAFNSDLPYDRFLTEQIAGDLLPAETQEQRNRQVIATGYLAMARRFGSLVERYPWHLTIEDTIDNVGRTMMGLTLSCARCHDHKFDPISTRDYYGIYGIFASTRYAFPGIELFQTQRDFVPLVPSNQVAETIGEEGKKKTDELVEELQKWLVKSDKQAKIDAEEEKSLSIDEQRKRRDALDAMLIKARKAGEKLAEHLKTLPAVPSAYAVQDDQPIDAKIQIKGEPNRPGATVPRGFPEILGGQRLPEDLADHTSGRLQLSKWITGEENPLTARVIVNRVWQKHFGEGLVSSSSDFGLRGENPSNPPLLDWLANDFMQHGWSIKHLHRRILNSRTYRLSSDDLEGNLVIDPNNRMHWKFNRQRLDAESIRDTLLELGGSLDREPQSEPHPFPDKQKWKYTQHHPFKDDYASNKRSVYLMTKRLTAATYFQTFDGPDRNVCTGDRDQSITALQALYFVNDEFLHEQANKFSQRLVSNVSEETDRIRYAFEKILGREPDALEQQMVAKHIAAVRAADSGQPDQVAWASLTRSLFRLNEFLYLD